MSSPQTPTTFDRAFHWKPDTPALSAAILEMVIRGAGVEHIPPNVTIHVSHARAHKARYFLSQKALAGCLSGVARGSQHHVSTIASVTARLAEVTGAHHTLPPDYFLAFQSSATVLFETSPRNRLRGNGFLACRRGHRVVKRAAKRLLAHVRTFSSATVEPVLLSGQKSISPSSLLSSSLPDSMSGASDADAGTGMGGGGGGGSSSSGERR